MLDVGNPLYNKGEIQIDMYKTEMPEWRDHCDAAGGTRIYRSTQNNGPERLGKGMKRRANRVQSKKHHQPPPTIIYIYNKLTKEAERRMRRH